MKRHLLLAQFAATPWALTPDYLSLMTNMLVNWSFNAPVAVDLTAKIGPDKEARAARGDAAGAGGAVAVIPVYGVITQRPPDDICGAGGCAADKVAAAVRSAAADPAVSAIVLDIDSPGGSVYGTKECADVILAAREQKPVIGIANSLAASAAFWLGSQCSEFYCTPGGEVGSVGVYTAHQFIGKALEAAGVDVTLVSAGQYKVEANPFEPLGDEAKAAIQARVDDYYGMFVKAVAKGRGVKVSDVRGGMGQGRVLGAEDALVARMVDGVATFDQVLAKVSGSGRSGVGRSRVASARRALALM